MSALRHSFPLRWPIGRERTHPAKWVRPVFSVTPAKALASLIEELRRLRVSEAELTANIPIRKDGTFYASAGEPDDPGIAVYIKRRGKAGVFALDHYGSFYGNVRGLALSIEAMRAIERHGGAMMMEAALAGAAGMLPPPGASPVAVERAPEPWFTVLGVFPEAPIEVAEAAYRALAKKAHPDAGGSSEAMGRLSRAIEEARARGAA